MMPESEHICISQFMPFTKIFPDGISYFRNYSFAILGVVFNNRHLVNGDSHGISSLWLKSS